MSEPTLLRALVLERHWQRWPTFEAQFRRAAVTLAEREEEPGLARTPVSQRQYERWYSGRLRTQPRPDACRVLEAMFGRPVSALLGPASGGQYPAVVEHQQQPAPPGAGPEDPGRTLAMTARRAIQFSARADQTNVGTGSLDQLLAEAARLAAAYPRQPLITIVGDIADLQDQTMTLLEGRQRPREARELYVVAGLASGMLAKASHDMGDPRTAMTHARTAWLCARNAEHPPLQAWVRGIESIIAYWASRPGEALEYARAGQQVEGVTGTVTVWLPSLEARAWSVLGNAAEAERAVDLAITMRDRTIDDDLDRLGGICRFDVARQTYYAADAGAMLSDPLTPLAGRTASTATEAIRLYETGPGTASFGDLAGSRADLAIARIRGGELDGAAEALGPVLDLPPQMRIHGVLTTVVAVHRALTPAKSPVARDLQGEIEAYTRTPAAAITRG
jgi:hypothetical protein